MKEKARKLGSTRSTINVSLWSFVVLQCVLSLSVAFLNPTRAYTSEKPQIRQAVQRATDILPHQAPIDKFVHHNPLSKLQNLEFENAMEHLQHLESYISPGERTFRITGDDPRKREKLAIVDLAAVFLDRGAAKWAPSASLRSRGFLYFFASLESKGTAGWRRYARTVAKEISKNMGPEEKDKEDEKVQLMAERIIQRNLERMGIPANEWDNCITSMLFKIRGWAGMFQRMEEHPEDAPPNTKVSLLEFCAVLTILARSAIQTVARESGAWNYQQVPLSAWLNQWPVWRKEKVQYLTVQMTSRIAEEYNTREERGFLEQRFQRRLINAVSASDARTTSSTSLSTSGSTKQSSPDIQFLTCIDDRMESFRRYLEQNNHQASVETFGVAGYFGLPIRYKSFGQQVALDMTPNGAATWDVQEITNNQTQDEVAQYKTRTKLLGQAATVFDRLSFSPPGSLLLLPLGPVFLHGCC